MHRIKGPMLEYACNENNVDAFTTLRNARAQEAGKLPPPDRDQERRRSEGHDYPARRTDRRRKEVKLAAAVSVGVLALGVVGVGVAARAAGAHRERRCLHRSAGHARRGRSSRCAAPSATARCSKAPPVRRSRVTCFLGAARQAAASPICSTRSTTRCPPMRRARSSRSRWRISSSFILQANKFPAGRAELGTDGRRAEADRARRHQPCSRFGRSRGPAPTFPATGTLNQVMRGILFPSSNVLFDVQTKDPGAGSKGGIARAGCGDDVDPLRRRLRAVDGGRCRGDLDRGDRPGADAAGAPMRERQAGSRRSRRLEAVRRGRRRGRAAPRTGRRRPGARTPSATRPTMISDACANCHRVYRDVPDRRDAVHPAQLTSTFELRSSTSMWVYTPPSFSHHAPSDPGGRHLHAPLHSPSPHVGGPDSHQPFFNPSYCCEDFRYRTRIPDDRRWTTRLIGVDGLLVFQEAFMTSRIVRRLSFVGAIVTILDHARSRRRLRKRR